METKQEACLDDRQISRLLDSAMDSSEEQCLQKHLDNCTSCQSKLEKAAADQPCWNHVSSHLSSDELLLYDAEVTSVYDPAPAEGAVYDLIGMLHHSDFPRSLGRIGIYEVTGVIGRGATGIVVKAFESILNRYVAIKILSPALSGNKAARKRFEQEGRAIAAVANEHVVAIHAVDHHQELPYIVMQYVAGSSLQQRIDSKGTLQVCEIVRIALQISNGLAAAHAQGIVHRDIKPANILLEHGIDRAVVGDFGLARVVDSASHTMSGMIAGTPQYMSPEQIQSEAIDSRSDLFSLGCVIYTMGTGHSPYRAETVFGVMRRICEEKPRSMRESNVTIPSWLDDLVTKLLHKDRERRFSSAEQVSQILSNELAYLQNPTSVAKPIRDWRPADSLPTVSSKRSLLMTIVSTAIAALVLAVSAQVLGPGGNDTPPVKPISGEEIAEKPAKVWDAKITPTPLKSEKPIKNKKKQKGKLKAAASVAVIEEAAEPTPPAVDITQAAAGEFTTIRGQYGDRIDGYTLYLPTIYDSSATTEFPVIVFLTGGLAVGGNVEQVNNWGIPSIVRAGLDQTPEELTEQFSPERIELFQFLQTGFIVVSPHLASGQYYDQDQAMKEILAEVTSECRIDEDRIYLTGLSRGGTGSWGLPTRMPGVFAAVAPMAGSIVGINDFQALSEVPLLVTHNIGDNIFEYDQTAQVVKIIEQLSGEKFYRIDERVPNDESFLANKRVLVEADIDSHNSWSKIYREISFYRWLLQHKRSK